MASVALGNFNRLVGVGGGSLVPLLSWFLLQQNPGNSNSEGKRKTVPLHSSSQHFPVLFHPVLIALFMIFSSFFGIQTKQIASKMFLKLSILSRNGTYNERLDCLKLYQFAAFFKLSCSFDQKLSFLFFHFKSSVNVRVVNQLLTEMDGLEARKQVFIMGATNRPGR